MSAYQPDVWSDFAVALVGAAAALVGLLFVAVSINLERIVAGQSLPARAVSTLVLFSLPLLLGIWLLIPDQARAVVGAELIGTGLAVGAVLMRNSRPALRTVHEKRRDWMIGRAFPSVAVPTLVVLAGATFMAEKGGGLYWLPPAIVLALLAGLATAWVLLVEILR